MRIRECAWVVTILFGIAMFAMAGPALAESCDCRSPDRSCSASVSCPEGCWAICGNNGQCSSGCAGGGPGGGGPRHDTLAMPLSAPATNLVSLHGVDLTAQGLADLVRDAIGGDVRFLPLDPLQNYSVHVSNLPPDDLTKALAKFGVVAVAGEAKAEELGAGAIPAAQVTIQLEESTMGEVVGLLGQLVAEAGTTLRVTDPSLVFSLDVNRMPLDELLAGMVKMGAIEIELD
jgi:hypothetical protein